MYNRVKEENNRKRIDFRDRDRKIDVFIAIDQRHSVFDSH